MDEIERIQLLNKLNRMLLDEMPEYQEQAQTFPEDVINQRRLLRSLMNLRPPMPLNPEFLKMQNELLSAEREQKGIISIKDLPVIAGNPKISVWQGDITRLASDAIVDADNSSLLGCFQPCHNCIDNAIHSAAGLQLRDECYQIMQAQGHLESTGQAKLTLGYNLPARYILHTVGPMIQGCVTWRDRKLLASCYTACLKLAAEKHLESIAFCCISTGVFRFPSQEAAEIAVKSVTNFLKKESSIKRVIFNVFKDADEQIYRNLLGPDQTIKPEN